MIDRNDTIQEPKAAAMHLEVHPAKSNDYIDDRHDYAGAHPKTDPAEIRLVRKQDVRVMPVLWCMYFLNYVDRGALSQAKLNNLESDLNMQAENFNTAVSILVVGYVLMQIPSNMLLTRVRPSLYLASCMLLWSVISTCTGLVQSYGGLLATRFFLGFFEAPFYPGALYLLAVFYTRKELATRISVLFTAQMAGLSFSNLIAAGVFAGLDGTRGLAGWRWMLFLEGSISAVTAIAAAFLLPDTRTTTWWLEPAERELAEERMKRDQLIHSHDRDTVWSALRDACRDKRTWLFCAIQNFHYAGLSFTNFLPNVLNQLGFSDTKALLLACPPYILAGVASVSLAYSSGRFHERTWHITVAFTVAIAGFVAAASTLDQVGRYVACFVFPVGTYAVNSVIVAWVGTTLSQSPEKKAIALAMTNVSAQIAAIYGPYLWPDSDGPRFLLGFSASAAFSFMSLVVCWAMRTLLQVENRQLKRGAARGETVNTYSY